MYYGENWTISIHAPREGSDRRDTGKGRPGEISIHAPREGSDNKVLADFYTFLFLSTLPARGATTDPSWIFDDGGISIHAPREGSDDVEAAFLCGLADISIHAPREGSDQTVADFAANVLQFLSTLPARGATVPYPRPDRRNLYFYPRSPRGERPRGTAIRASANTLFLSTLPARGATHWPGASG